MTQIAITLALLFNAAVATADLCPPLEPLPSGIDDLRLSERDFTEEKFRSALAYFDSDLPSILHDAMLLETRINGSAFWISYRNSLTHLKGYLLRERALLETDPVERREAVSEFCGFLNGARWVD